MKKIPVYYSPNMVVVQDSASPSAEKPRRVKEFWEQNHNTICDIVVPQKLSLLSTNEFERYASRLHTREYIKGLFELKEPNGFGSHSKEVLDAIVETNKVYIWAAEELYSTDNEFAVCPVSGFHHATMDSAQGFCTLNGLVLAANSLIHFGSARVGIVDCDHHYGNGTDDFLKNSHLKNFHIPHFTAGAGYQSASRHNAEQFLEELAYVLEREFIDRDIILYQAGADQHWNDPYGGFLTSAQMLQRDRIVFEFCAKRKIKCLWNLAGGYQLTESGQTNWDALLRLHTNTLLACSDVLNVESPGAKFFPDLQDLP